MGLDKQEVCWDGSAGRKFMKIKIAGPGDMTKSGVSPHVSAVETISSFVRNVVTNMVSIVAEGKGRHAWEHRVGAGMSGAPKVLAE